MVSPVTPEVGLFTEVAEAVPDTTDQAPDSNPETDCPARVAVAVSYNHLTLPTKP